MLPFGANNSVYNEISGGEKRRSFISSRGPHVSHVPLFLRPLQLITAFASESELLYNLL